MSPIRGFESDTFARSSCEPRSDRGCTSRVLRCSWMIKFANSILSKESVMAIFFFLEFLLLLLKLCCGN
jgi:hypothetical protein